jgi:polynucleotide 5'-hydroxyl-kinase GRC3/NOL9
MGWNQGLGLCLLKEQINILQPTFILQLNSNDLNKNLPSIDYEWFKNSSGWPTKQNNYSIPNYKLLTIDRSSSSSTTNNRRLKTSNYSAKDHRAMAIIAYFSSLQDRHSFFKPIHHIKPYRVPWSHFALHVAHMKVSYEELFRVFNASLVGLCKIEDKYIKKPSSDSPGYLDFNGGNEIQLFKCYGFGIIRGINMDTREFYVITPEPLDKLNQVNLFVKGIFFLN